MVERRKWKRYEIGYPLEGEGSYEEGTLTLTDVSREGLSFTAGRNLCEGDRIDLRIFLKHRMFKIKALIVHVKDMDEKICSIGAKFLNEQNDFPLTLEKEVEEIKELYRQSNIYSKKTISFKEASSEYLERKKDG